MISGHDPEEEMPLGENANRWVTGIYQCGE